MHFFRVRTDREIVQLDQFFVGVVGLDREVDAPGAPGSCVTVWIDGFLQPSWIDRIPVGNLEALLLLDALE